MKSNITIKNKTGSFIDLPAKDGSLTPEPREISLEKNDPPTSQVRYPVAWRNKTQKNKALAHILTSALFAE